MKPSFLPSPKMSLTVMALAFFMTSVSLPSTSIAKSATSGSDGPVAAPSDGPVAAPSDGPVVAPSDGPVAAPYAMEKPASFTFELGPNPAKASTEVTINASKKSFYGEIRIHEFSSFNRALLYVYIKRDIKIPAGKSKSFKVDTARHKPGSEYVVYVADYLTGSKSSTHLFIE